jgi:hypothetical protein
MMLDICIQTSYDQSVQLILKSYLPVVYGTPLREIWWCLYADVKHHIRTHCQNNKKIKRADHILSEVYGTPLNAYQYADMLK